MNLIITAATGYQAEQLFPFLNSIERNCKSVRVFMIVYKKDIQAVNTLRNRYPFLEFTTIAQKSKVAVKLFRLVNDQLEASGYLSTSSSLESLRRYFLHIAIERYFIALNIVKSCGDSISNVLLTDSRDVLIQGDPFALIDGSLVSGLEAEQMTIESCSINSSWIRTLYGKDGLSKIGGRRIVCSGVTMGPTQAIEKYLVEMCNEIETYLPKVASSDSIDQGIHNYLIGTGRISIETVDNTSGLIATLGYEKSFAISQDQSTGLIRVYDKYPAIVHQYDRHSALETMDFKSPL